LKNRGLREVIDDIFLRFNKTQDGYLSSKEIVDFVKHSFVKTASRVKAEINNQNWTLSPKMQQIG
jgi:Ca2+-binding EF-hand superfamily protein